MEEPSHIFVYGTLRSESAHPMARRLRARARHLGKGTVPGRLYDLGWYPAAVFAATDRRRIVGDVFALGLDGKALAEIDAYEGGDALYRRVTLEVKLARGGTVTAWAYGMAEAPNRRLIESGDFIAHRNARKPRNVRS